MTTGEKWGVAHMEWDDGYSEEGDSCGSPHSYVTREEAEARAAKLNASDWPRERWWVAPFDELGPPSGPVPPVTPSPQERQPKGEKT